MEIGPLSKLITKILLKHCRVLGFKDKRLTGQYNFVKLGSLSGLGMRTSLHGTVYLIANEPLNTSVRYLIVILSTLCTHAG